MLIEAARRAEAAARDMLACVNGGAASCEEMREALAVSKAVMSITSAFQARAASNISRSERHGDGGIQVLAEAAGLSRSEARGQVKTTEAVDAAPAVRDALEDGRVSLANAKRLAEAVEKTSATDVEGDRELLAKAETMRPEDFTRESRRWAADRQADGGEGDYRRMRARRCVRVWDTDDGMVQLHGKFDPATGRRIGNRLQAEARRLYDADKRNARDAKGASRKNGVRQGDGGVGGRRTFDQCMADALDALTSNGGNGNSCTEPTAGTINGGSGNDGGGKPFADITVVAHIDNSTGKLIAEIAGGGPLPASVFEEIACNARLRAAIYDTRGTLLWQGRTKRVATEAQMNALTARYGGCFHCLAHPDMCQAHHIKPVSEGGRTDIENMVLVCWDCHQKIHHHDWEVRTRNGRHTLHPPGRTTYGPAHAPERPRLHSAGKTRSRASSPRSPIDEPPSPQPELLLTT